MTELMKKIKLLIADDQVLIAQSLKIVLEHQGDDLSVIGIAENGKQVLELVEKDMPHLILMDVRMPVMDGVSATRIINKSFSGIKIIMLTTFDDDEYAQQAIEAGAVGYLLKDISVEELIASIHAAYHGAVLISPTVATKLIGTRKNQNAEWQSASSPGGSAPGWVKELSLVEREILSLVKHGKSNKEIAGELFLAEQTIKNYLSRLYSKIGVDSRMQARRLLANITFI